MQELDPHRTTWHITFGTYGTRLHGGEAITVARPHNLPGDPFVTANSIRHRYIRDHMIAEPLYLTTPQRLAIEAAAESICDRGRWMLRTIASPPEPDNNHVHVLLDAEPAIHGKSIRQWFKRWLTEHLETQWPRPASGRWWAKGGSTKPVKNESYLNNAFDYIKKQRTTV